MKFPKLYIGPMSKNVVDAVIEYANEHKVYLGLIPSRRQVDFNSGYVNDWTTSTLVDYVQRRSPFVVLVRDHGGPYQGATRDLGYDSFAEDSNLLDVIHVDPWRESSFQNALKRTAHYIRFCESINDHVVFEVGTEEAIYGYEADQLDDLLNYLRDELWARHFSRIKIAVIQSGTSLHDGANTGTYSKQRLEDMLSVCKRHGLLSKEHNGDYLDSKLIRQKFSAGLDSINIAPEFGQIETKALVEVMTSEQKDKFYDICLKSGKWKKWTSDSENKDLIINVAGHYVFSEPAFKKLRNSLSSVDEIAKKRMKDRIHSICKGKK